jgi:hypothetical protein
MGYAEVRGLDFALFKSGDETVGAFAAVAVNYLKILPVIDDLSVTKSRVAARKITGVKSDNLQSYHAASSL